MSRWLSEHRGVLAVLGVVLGLLLTELFGIAGLLVCVVLFAVAWPLSVGLRGRSPRRGEKHVDTSVREK